jgi:hypothetical protein
MLSTPVVGTNWDNDVTNSALAIVRIAAVDRNGVEYCGFGSATVDVTRAWKPVACSDRPRVFVPSHPLGAIRSILKKRE